jgi:hypothetical protein
MNILRNDKVVLIKEMDNMRTVGEVFEVANITDTAVVLRNAMSKVAVGAVDINVFDQYFSKPEDIKTWTKWYGLMDTKGNTVAFYRTNHKKVQVRTPEGIQAEACCNKSDDFNLFFGIQLAYLRCKDKALKNFVTEYDPILKDAKSSMIDNQHLIKKMINSLDKKNEEAN